MKANDAFRPRIYLDVLVEAIVHPSDRPKRRPRPRPSEADAFCKKLLFDVDFKFGFGELRATQNVNEWRASNFFKKLSSWSLVFDPIKRYNFTAKKCDWGSVCGSVWKEQSLPTPTSGQSYKAYTIVNYDSRVVPDWKIPHITTLESKFTIVEAL